MSKILCNFDGHEISCKVIENMGYQGGNYVKSVEYNGEERIVIKCGLIWRPKMWKEKLMMRGYVCGQ